MNLGLGTLGMLRPPGGGAGVGGLEKFGIAVENAYDDGYGICGAVRDE